MSRGGAGRRGGEKPVRGGAGLLLCLALTAGLLAAPPAASADEDGLRKQIIPILATSLDENERPVGVVAELEIELENRHDVKGMNVSFENRPGKFSPAAQVAVVAAILDVARVANMSTDSWSISLKVPYPGVTVYGTSLSAMVGLTVIALAQGEFVKPDRVVTGTITRDGHIGPVSGISLKLQAASIQHLHRVLVPEEYDVTDGDWEVPFMLHVTPVGTVRRAYQALTDAEFPLSAHSRS